jgi:hypothetical protein
MKKLLVSGLIVSVVAILGSARISEPFIILLLASWVVFATRQHHSVSQDISGEGAGILW